MKNKTFDFVNFAYGVGAAIVITGAMAKFLGWDFANQLFMVGLTAETIVFLISAFEYKELTKIRPEYKWEKLFPQLISDAGEQTHVVNENASDSDTVTDSLKQLDDTIKHLNTTTAQLARSIDNINNNIIKTEDNSLKFEQGFNELQENITRLNVFYSDMLRVAGRDHLVNEE